MSTLPTSSTSGTKITAPTIESAKVNDVTAIAMNDEIWCSGSRNGDLYRSSGLLLKAAHSRKVRAVTLLGTDALASADTSVVKVWKLPKKEHHGSLIIVRSLTEKKRKRRAPEVTALVSPSLDRLAMATQGGEISVWDVNEKRSLQTVTHEKGVQSLSARSHTLVSGGDDGVVKLWDLRTQEPTWQSQSFGAPIVSVAHDQNYVLSGAGATLFVTDLRIPSLPWLYSKEHAHPLIEVGFCGESIFAAADRSGTITFKDLQGKRSEATDVESPLSAAAFGGTTQFLTVSRAGDPQLYGFQGFQDDIL